MKSLSLVLDIFFLRLCSLFKNQYIAVSNRTKEDFCKIYNVKRNKVTVINLASSFDKILVNSFKINIKKKYILCVSTIEPRKNHLNLLIAYSKLNKDLRDEYNLIIVGKNGWGSINLELIVLQLNLNSDVKIFQNVNDNQLAFLYKFAYLTIYPSFYEGCGLPILESNGFGTPTVVSDIEPMNSLCPSSSIVFDPFDADSIARSIYLAITNVVLYNRLKANTIEEIKKYSWTKSANELYETLIN